MKRVRILLLGLLCVLLTGCADTRKALSPDEFSETLKGLDYTVLDKTDTVDYADAAYYVNTDDFEFVYINGKRRYDIEGLFVEECKNMVSIIGSEEYEKDLHSGENYAYAKFTTKDNFYYVSWIDDTYIYIKASINEREDLEYIIEKLGY